MIARFTKTTVFIVISTILVACMSSSHNYRMDDQTRDHPATQRFIDFAKQAKTVASFEALTQDFYTPAAQQRINNAMGWKKLTYSSPYQMLKEGRCDTITLKKKGNRVQIDCVGTMTIKSPFLEDRVEPSHLRVFMIRFQGKWFLDQSGYVYATTISPPVSYSRFGIKFKSDLEP